MSVLQEWTHEVAHLGSQISGFSRSADTNERAALCSALDLDACTSLTFDYEIRRSSRGRYVVDGVMRCKAQQRCVVSLEPIDVDVETPITEEFWPADQIEAGGDAEIEVSSAECPEPIVDDRLGVGQVVFDALACVMDPFPRKDGAELETTEPGRSDGSDTGPFAVLAKLKS